MSEINCHGEITPRPKQNRGSPYCANLAGTSCDIHISTLAIVAIITKVNEPLPTSVTSGSCMLNELADIYIFNFLQILRCFPDTFYASKHNNILYLPKAETVVKIILGISYQP